MKKTIITICLAIALPLAAQGSVLIASDHGYPIRIGMNVSELNWIYGVTPKNPCAGVEGKCLVSVSQRVAGGKASVELEINTLGVIKDIIVK